MKGSQRNLGAVRQINALINSYINDRHDKLIVGIDGTSGTGKTAIALDVTFSRDDTSIISLDCFWNKKIGRRYAGWFNIKKIQSSTESFRKKNYGEKIIRWEHNKTERKLSIDFQKKILLIDGVFLCDTLLFPHIFDKVIYMTAREDDIERRRIYRMELKKYSSYEIKEKQVQYALFDSEWSAYLRKWSPEKNADAIIRL
ncbi:MAG: hypothetical protein A2934_00980 [Candidatus Sungbacteria bacterium RIFCSPLOWO2_01_FULL_47_10]|uniref:Phosphoribulokinase/uridine kinase domain-containing protein n=1 Tax=Candidatus Sungbacteria bacterium RIFCSPLOWO2_01_FULL_47_10 TaxID=1802276 RepID=A0A1G2L4K9_9BACT|nr:MAG: hypothetical protein A2934_00980 [Candidatus Sungbacteria bacterium RIFCSPLOWO2_01_FULL_47_10]